MKYLTIAEFADRAGVTSQSVYQRINIITDGTIESINTPNLPYWIKRRYINDQQL